MNGDGGPGDDRHRLPLIGHAAGGLLGGLAGATVAVAVTETIKRLIAVVSRQEPWLLVALPLVGLAASTIVLHVVGHGAGLQTVDGDDDVGRARRRPSWWRSFHGDVARADLTGDVVRAAGAEEGFPWRVAPVRVVAIVSTVGSGAPMGTESPAAHLGMATGAALGALPTWLRRLARPLALGGGAAGVAALIGIPLVGLLFVLELGRRREIPVTAPRVVAALGGAVVGWAINVTFDLDLIRLVVPDVRPGGLPRALGTAVVVGALAGALASFTGSGIYRARAWRASTGRRFVVGGLGVAAAIAAIAVITEPTAGIGPGAAVVAWAQEARPAAPVLLAVALLRALATVGAVTAGGCGGVFVPFLAIGDLAGRAVAPLFGVSGDLAGSAGAAGGIAGGYRLPLTAAAMVSALGGPYQATLTCLATVAVAAMAGVAAGRLLDSSWARAATARVTRRAAPDAATSRGAA